jgi:hypothetical protein
LLNGALYWITVESLTQLRIWYRLPSSASVWAVDYAILPAAMLYKPIREYDRKTFPLQSRRAVETS